jgi:hypothetical protein
MQIDAIQLKILIQEKIKIWLLNKLCLYCKESYHIAQNCSNKRMFKAKGTTSINNNILLKNNMQL